MKRIILTILAATAILSAAAQTDTTHRRIDTVQFPLDKPTYFQNEWINGRDRYEFMTYRERDMVAKVIARRYEKFDSLKIIGLAGVFGISRPEDRPSAVYADTSIENRLPEWLHLYKCTPDTFQLVKAMSFRFTDAVCRLDVWSEARDHRFPGLYEVYFDEPVTVRDSFYVGGTTDNNDIRIPGVGRQNLETDRYHAIPLNTRDTITVRGRILHNSSSSPLDTTRWHTTKTLQQHMYFPIIDTTGMYTPDTNQGGDTTGVDTNMVDTTKISSLVEQLSQIYPNPATDNAVVFSSVPMRSVALYDPTGRCVLRRRVDGTTVQLDLKGIARGQCLVVINTPAGRAVKRLLLQ